ncbi:MAG: YicC/YloC family endoribonuclease [Hyphomicrobiaceae bacterium]
MTVMSMTGFARIDGADDGATWFWEIRTVNGRGLDVRLRLPPGADQIELPARELVAKRLTRGNVTLQLNQRRTASGSVVVVNENALHQVLEIASDLRERFDAPPPTVEGMLGLRGVLDTVEIEDPEDVVAARTVAQLADLEKGLDALIAARAGEGRRLGEIVEQQLKGIFGIIEAVTASPARTPEAIALRLGDAIKRLLDEKAASFDTDRLHQEAVLLATKADVEEELQRLRAHVAAAHELLASEGSIGRRLDFLTQEFNREANTLCSKSNDVAVTKLGLELKSTIEQMREQVQNIE